MTQENKLTIGAIILFTIFLFGMTKANAASLIKVAVIDSGFSPIPWDKSGFKLCEDGHYDFTTNQNKVGSDDMAHGSYVVSIINTHANTDNICFLIYKIFGGIAASNKLNLALVRAYKNGATVINLSLISKTHSYETESILKRLATRNIKIFVAAGNDAQNLNDKCNIYPQCYNIGNENIVRVGALDEDFDVAKYSNFGTRITLYKSGRTVTGAKGTSFAAPRAAGDYIRSLNNK